jgi:CheY-like chemotaxis protein/anti-sigma regulatory factor (Ser/Thr protein kinase)
VKLTSRLAEGVPFQILGDSTRLRQILLNLLGNAVKFTPEGEINLRVFLSDQTASGKRLVFEVQDTGIGISADKVDRLFRPFSQADSSTTRKFGGTGLGLAICKRLVDLMGGTISLVSETNRGSLFTFSLPVEIPEGSESLSPSEVSPSSLPSVPEKNFAALPRGKTGREESWPPLHVLMAEDNPVNERVLRLILKKYGYTPDLAHNGKEAVSACTGKDYDLVIMDVQMPEMDGYQASQKIRAQESVNQPYIIALTADAMPDDRAKCLQAGMNDYLTKPVNLAKFEEALIRCLNGRSQES